MTKTLDYIGLTLAMLLWGATYIWSKAVFTFYSPLETIFIRVIISFVILFLWRKTRPAPEPVLPKDRSLILLLSFLQPFLYFMGENYGLFYASATVAAVFVGTIPIFSMLLGRLVYKQSLGRMGVLGAGVCFLGVLLVIISGTLTIEISPLGALGLLLAIASGSSYGLLVIRLGGRYSAITLTYLQNRNALFFFTPFILIFNPDIFTRLPPFHIGINLLALAVFGSVTAFVLFTHGIARLGMGKAYSFSNLIPVFTAFFATLFLGEKLYWYNIIGVLMVVAGLFFVNRKTDQSGVKEANC
jgi:drug/metabolite transporter (DMT)-like permease